MAIRRYKPTSPGRRFQTVSSFEEITATEPERNLLRCRQQIWRSQQQWPHNQQAPRRWAQAPLPAGGLQALEGWGSGSRCLHRVRPQQVGACRAVALRGRREAIYPGAGWPASWGIRDVRAAGGYSARERHGVERHAPRYDDSQHRTFTGEGRTTCEERGGFRPAHGAGRKIRATAAGIGRDAPGAGNMPGNDWPGRQHRPRERFGRQGREVQVAGAASQCSRRGHESG